MRSDIVYGSLFCLTGLSICLVIASFITILKIFLLTGKKQFLFVFIPWFFLSMQFYFILKGAFEMADYYR
jgi:hypothetical protein